MFQCTAGGQPWLTSDTHDGKQAAGAHIHDLRRRFGRHDHLLLIWEAWVSDEQHVTGKEEGGRGSGVRLGGIVRFSMGLI